MTSSEETRDVQQQRVRAVTTESSRDSDWLATQKQVANVYDDCVENLTVGNVNTGHVLPFVVTGVSEEHSKTMRSVDGVVNGYLPGESGKRVMSASHDVVEHVAEKLTQYRNNSDSMLSDGELSLRDRQSTITPVTPRLTPQEIKQTVTPSIQAMRDDDGNVNPVVYVPAYEIEKQGVSVYVCGDACITETDAVEALVRDVPDDTGELVFTVTEKRVRAVNDIGDGVMSHSPVLKCYPQYSNHRWLRQLGELYERVHEPTIPILFGLCSILTVLSVGIGSWRIGAGGVAGGLGVFALDTVFNRNETRTLILGEIPTSQRLLSVPVAELQRCREENAAQYGCVEAVTARVEETEYALRYGDREYRSVKAHVTRGDGCVQLHAEINGCCEEWVFELLNNDVVPEPVRSIVTATPIHENTVVIQVSEINGSETHGAMLKSESGNWVLET